MPRRRPLGATSHPDLVAAVVRLCLDAGASRVTVTDNPINDPASCFALSGIDAAARQAGAEVVVPRESLFARYTAEGGRLIRDWPVLYAPLARADRIIGLAPVKDHHRSGASMTLKNWYGLLGRTAQHLSPGYPHHHPGTGHDDPAHGGGA